MEHRPELNVDKMRELVLYVARRLAGQPANGSIKRNKVLAFADFNHYARYGESITGAEYVKHAFGPAPRGIRELEHRMEENGDAVTVVLGGAQAQKLLFPRREPDVSLFSGAEIKSVEEALDLLDDMTGMESSDLAHAEMLGWKYGAERCPIPYETVFLYDGPVTAADREAGDRVLAKLSAST